MNPDPLPTWYRPLFSCLQSRTLHLKCLPPPPKAGRRLSACVGLSSCLSLPVPGCNTQLYCGCVSHCDPRLTAMPILSPQDTSADGHCVHSPPLIPGSRRPTLNCHICYLLGCATQASRLVTVNLSLPICKSFYIQRLLSVKLTQSALNSV